jgi:Fe/S biogenesis protein NfuA
MLNITNAAKSKILEYMKAEPQPGLALRVAIKRRGPAGFEYDLGFVKTEEKLADDTVIDAGGFQVFIDPGSAPKLNGATLDYVTGLWESGFKIENPNSIWNDPVAVAVQRVIDNHINPGVAAHGGHVTLLEVKDGIAYVSFGGGCQGCGMVDVTLRQGIEVMIRNAVPEIKQIIDATDHAGGRNPYYQSAEGGQSPLV